ncbi:putative cohesin subunit [Triangularia verruculosa]|uniref:Cohesin subunit n=1 Tax=Triangularia verruculosa TaxID=2587418 RepID=A0AAN6XPD7_9PEZI|nr:putative cohesin subunit [Triangularia verruculosa]
MLSRRQPLMETSDNNATGSPAPTSSARRSGRVSKAPSKFTPDAPVASKRKRAADNDDEDDDQENDDAENEAPDDEEDNNASDDDDGSETATEEPRRAKKKKKAPSSSARPRKPATKKPKTNGDAPSHDQIVGHLPSRPKKAVRLAITRPTDVGLYADIFASGDSSDKVATEWYHKYQADDAAAVAELVNCILLSAGCDQQVTPDDIRDPENCSNRLADLQNVYTEEGITDYPLVAKSKTTRSFRDLLVGFFKSLLTVLHETDILYKDTALMENIARWVASMSSSTLRPFRHTATTVALAMEAALVEIAKKLDDRVSKMTHQLDAEKKRKGKNKERLAVIEKNLKEAEESQSICQAQILDFFDTVFLQRYRDVDARIRCECVEALGGWIWNLPTQFETPEYLRYLGWMLTDVMPQTRLESLKQVTRLFKRDAEKLGHFIDRFRPRLVEMATKDSDVSVRVAAILAIHILKDTGMLEPDEIDSIGRLIFDSELRVRRAVIDFFAGCVNDSIEGKVEQLGGSDVIDEVLGEEDDDDYSSPRRDWISIKCLAELLAAYDAQLEEEISTAPPRGLDIAVEMIQAVAPETRISLASQVLYEKIDQVKNWEILSGYLLHDHTTSTKSKSKSRASKSNSNEAAFKAAVAPEGHEEAIILEILASAVKLSLSPTTEVDRHRRKPRTDAADAAEESAIHLAANIPRLLNKFGADEKTAVIVLRLEHSLPLDIFQQLRQDSTTFSRLLDEICTQFDRHVDRGVLTEATAALLHARKHDELQEITDSKIADLWEIVINALRHFDKNNELSIRGNMDPPTITGLGNILLKMSKLASIANPTEFLESSDNPAIELLIKIIHRGKLDAVDETLDDLEDEAVSFAVSTVQFYFMWKVRSLIGSVQSRADISRETILDLNSLRQDYSRNLIWTLSSRGTNDELRLFSTGGLCDLHVCFATLRTAIAQQSTQGAASPRSYPDLEPLLEAIRPDLTNELIEIFDAAERAYAKCLKRTLNEPAEDEDPIDEELSDDEEGEEELMTPVERKGKELRLERALCELAGKYVLAMLAKMLDQQGSGGRLRKRMMRNQSKLGGNLKEVLAYLDEGKLRDRVEKHANRHRRVVKGMKRGAGGVKGGNGGGNGGAAVGGGGGGKKLSEEIVVDGEDDSELSEVELELEEDPIEEGEGTEEDLRRRGLGDGEEEVIDGGGDGDGGERMEEDSVIGD